MDGRLEHGYDVEVGSSGGVRLLAQSRQPESYVLSPAFVNAHSHLEYRGFLGAIAEPEYFGWIMALTRLKYGQTEESLRHDCSLAASENRATGVALIAEHSDRPFSAEGLHGAGVRGQVFQEVITAGEADVAAKLRRVEERMAVSARFMPTVLSPHAPYTVDESTLRSLVSIGGPLSIHVAESVHENRWCEAGDGPIADVLKDRGRGSRVVPYLASLGYLRAGVQFVHACDVTLPEVEAIAAGGVSVAHCPRSNERLQCPRAPVREMLDAGVCVGLGMDSAASGGPVDMFAEMRAALSGVPLQPEEVWRMATLGGASSLGHEGWDLESAPLIKLHVPSAKSVSDLIQRGKPDRVEWVS